MVTPSQLTVLITAIGYPCRTYTISNTHRNPQLLNEIKLHFVLNKKTFSILFVTQYYMKKDLEIAFFVELCTYINVFTNNLRKFYGCH